VTLKQARLKRPRVKRATVLTPRSRTRLAGARCGLDIFHRLREREDGLPESAAGAREVPCAPAFRASRAARLQIRSGFESGLLSREDYESARAAHAAGGGWRHILTRASPALLACRCAWASSPRWAAARRPPAWTARRATGRRRRPRRRRGLGVPPPSRLLCRPAGQPHHRHRRQRRRRRRRRRLRRRPRPRPRPRQPPARAAARLPLQ